MPNLSHKNYCIESFSKEIRKLSLKMVAKANASHIGSALSIADILAVLYHSHLRIYPSQPEKNNRDRFLLSKGHACTALYAALATAGFFHKDELELYGQDFSKFMNHASHYVPGVEFSMGALGHAMPIACGIGLGAKLKKEKWKIYTLLSDGELQEGSNWEAFMFASHHKLSNIVACIDFNNLQSLKTVSETLNIMPLKEKLQAFGWHVQECNGHNHKSIKESLDNCRKFKNLPSAIIFKTIKGKGVSFMENKVSWHYKSPDERELKLALEEIG